eukprot:UN13071
MVYLEVQVFISVHSGPCRRKHGDILGKNAFNGYAHYLNNWFIIKIIECYLALNFAVHFVVGLWRTILKNKSNVNPIKFGTLSGQVLYLQFWLYI